MTTNDRSVNSSPLSLSPSSRPTASTYDSGYEHSLEHLIEVRYKVESVEQDPGLATTAKAS